MASVPNVTEVVPTIKNTQAGSDGISCLETLFTNSSDCTPPAHYACPAAVTEKGQSKAIRKQVMTWWHAGSAAHKVNNAYRVKIRMFLRSNIQPDRKTGCFPGLHLQLLKLWSWPLKARYVTVLQAQCDSAFIPEYTPSARADLFRHQILVCCLNTMSAIFHPEIFYWTVFKMKRST